MGRHGENIRKRKDGRWEARYIQDYNSDGKAHYRYLYGKTYKEVKEKRKNELLNLQKKIESSDELYSYTFKEISLEWLSSRKNSVKASTYAHYTNMLQKHLLPDLGDDLITELSQEKLESFFQRKLNCGRLDKKGGLSAKTVYDLRSMTKLILTYADRKGAAKFNGIAFSIPVNRLKKVKILSRQEQTRLEQVLFTKRSPICIGILVSLYAGLRIGEVCALQWKDLNFIEGTLKVDKTLLRIRDIAPDAAAKTKILIEPPKTECSNRIIPLPEFLLYYLKDMQKEPEVYLLTGTKHYMEPRACLGKYKEILSEANIKDYNFHALRHTFATRYVENNVDIKSLSEIMGHSTVNITLQRYVHPSLEVKKEQINKLSAITIYSQKCGHADQRIV